MAFKIIPKNVIKLPVHVVPAEGDVVTIDVTFKHLKRSEFKAIASKIEEKTLTIEGALAEVILDIEGLIDEEDNDVKFKPEMLADLLDYEELYQALSSVFMELGYGLREIERRKNLQEQGKLGR